MSYCLGTYGNGTKLVGKTAYAKNNKWSEYEVLKKSLAASLVLLELSVCRIYTEEFLRILCHKSFNVTQFNDRASTVEHCMVLTKSMSCMAEKAEINSKAMKKEQRMTRYRQVVYKGFRRERAVHCTLV